VCRQGAANQLARAVFFFPYRQAIDLKNRIEIAIAMHKVAPCRLKIAFCQLGFDEEIAQFQIHLTSILGAVLQGDPRPDPKLGMDAGWDSEQGTDGLAAQDSRVAKDVHEQGVRAVRTFELASCAIRFSGKETRASVDLSQPRLPGWLLQNAFVDGREEVAVFASLSFCIDNAGHGAVAHLRQESGCARNVPMAEFAAQCARAYRSGNSPHAFSIGE
jgi:hypothetical protein